MNAKLEKSWQRSKAINHVFSAFETEEDGFGQKSAVAWRDEQPLLITSGYNWCGSPTLNESFLQNGWETSCRNNEQIHNKQQSSRKNVYGILNTDLSWFSKKYSSHPKITVYSEDIQKNQRKCRKLTVVGALQTVTSTKLIYLALRRLSAELSFVTSFRVRSSSSGCGATSVAQYSFSGRTSVLARQPSSHWYVTTDRSRPDKYVLLSPQVERILFIIDTKKDFCEPYATYHK